MLQKNKWIFVFLIFPLLTLAQGETANWCFGERAGLQFQSNGTVIPLTDRQINTFEGCASISDSFGELLFYTDGITVYNKNHLVMENGNGLYEDPSSTQSAIIIPKPEDPGKLYIFTVDTSTPGTHTLYVRDKNDCGIVEETFMQDITVEGFPKFFTPNGDLINDFWQFVQPVGIDIIVLNSILIYNRYGKFLKQITQDSQG